MAARRHVGGSGCPLLLAVETSCGTASVALLRGEELLSEEQAAAGRSGAESLLPCIDAVLRRAGLALEEVEAFAISIGEINATLMLYTPGLTTMPIAIYRLIASYNYFAACALGTVLMGICFLVFLVIDKMGFEVA